MSNRARDDIKLSMQSIGDAICLLTPCIRECDYGIGGYCSVGLGFNILVIPADGNDHAKQSH